LRNHVLPSLNYEIPWGYFDGTSQRFPPKCGVDVVLFINQNHYIHIRYAPGGGLNISLDPLLETAKENDIRKLQIMGDFKLAIEWAQGKLSI